MAVRKKDYPLEKVTLNLREGDWEWLRQMHGRLGASEVIRELVMGHRKRSEEKAAQRHTILELGGVNVEGSAG